jgi:hypothetical protein
LESQPQAQRWNKTSAAYNARNKNAPTRRSVCALLDLVVLVAWVPPTIEIIKATVANRPRIL